MLHTPLCALLGIEFPIIQAGMAAFTSAELAAAVSNAGGLGSVGTFLRPVEDLPPQLARSAANGPVGPSLSITWCPRSTRTPSPTPWPPGPRSFRLRWGILGTWSSGRTMWVAW